MAVRSIVVSVALHDITQLEPADPDAVVRIFADAFREELRRVFPGVAVGVQPGFAEPEIEADTDAERQIARGHIGAAYNRLMGQGGAWQALLREPVEAR